MSYRTLLLLYSLCALSFAFSPQETESFFYLSPLNELNQPFIRTKNNILMYDVDVIMSGFSATPQFLSVNLQSDDSSRIIEDLASSCGQNNATYNRLYYHGNTSSLVYYCTKNNTLMVLDENNYSVLSSIVVPMQETTQFNETKFYSEGESVVILGMGSPFADSITASQLIKINLQTQQVVRQMTFNQGLGDGEIITAYSSTGVLSFVLTNTESNETNESTVVIYSVVFVGNLYKLTRLVTFTYEITDLHLRTCELYCLGDYLVTNDYENLLVINVLGKVVSNYTNLTFIQQPPPSSPQAFDVPIYAMRHGGSSLYAQLNNNSVLKVTATGATFTSEIIMEAVESHLAIGNPYAHDLLFSTIYFNFTVFDLEDEKLEFNALVSNIGIFLTNSTYCSYNDGELNVFARTTHLPITNITLGDIYFYEQLGQVFYYILNITQSSEITCQLLYFQPDTQTSGVVASIPSDNNCSTIRSLYASFTNNIASPNYAYWNEDEYNVFTSISGLVTGSMSSSTQTIGVPDFNTLTVFTVTPNDYNNSTFIVEYSYNNEKESFIITNDFTLTNVSYTASENYVISGNQTITVFTNQTSYVINLAESKSQEYDLPFTIATMTSFQDNSEENYVIFSRKTFGVVGNPPPEYLGPDEVLTPLPETDQFTQRAGAAGLCTYFVEEGYISSLITIRFYNICSNENEQIISI